MVVLVPGEIAQNLLRKAVGVDEWGVQRPPTSLRGIQRGDVTTGLVEIGGVTYPGRVLE